MLFFLKVFLDRPLHPDNASQEDEGERRKDHQVVAYVSKAVEDVKAEERSAAEQLTEESYDYEDESVAGPVGHAVKEAGQRLVAQGKGLDASHDYAVGYDEPDVDRELLVDGVGRLERLEHLVHQDDHHGHNHQLDDDPYTAGNGVPEQGEDQAGYSRNHDDRKGHHQLVTFAITLPPRSCIQNPAVRQGRGYYDHVLPPQVLSETGDVAHA